MASNFERFHARPEAENLPPERRYTDLSRHVALCVPSRLVHDANPLLGMARRNIGRLSRAHSRPHIGQPLPPQLPRPLSLTTRLILGNCLLKRVFAADFAVTLGQSSRAALFVCCEPVCRVASLGY